MEPTREEVERFLLSLSGSITDETPVDWDAIQKERPDLGSRLDGLRTIESIALAHRKNAYPDARAAVGGGPSRDRAPVLFRWGHLDVLARVGQGSFGEVYRAFDTTLQREVALKLWPATNDATPARVRRALEEARQLARVRHPNVLFVHGADVQDGRAGFWSDFIRGKTLEEKLQNDGPLGAGEAAQIGIELCRALAAIHAAGLVHGDVKTANVMREAGGRIVLMDFGSVSNVHEGAGDGRPQCGTPLSAAPEILAGEPATPAGDLYALGVLLHRLVTGSYPIHAATTLELIAKHHRGERIHLRDVRPDLPQWFVDVVERSLAANPRERFSSAGAMEAALGRGAQVDSQDGMASNAARSGIKILGMGFIVAGVLLVSKFLFVSAERTSPSTAATRTSSSEAVATPSTGASERFVEHATPEAPRTLPALQVNASLHRVRNGIEEALPSGALIHTGEDLFLRVRGSEAIHVYVLDEDETKKLFVLFPVAGLDVTNPLSGGVDHRLPGTRAGILQDWQVTSAGGREWILVVASRERLLPIEQEIASFPAADASRPLEYGELSSQALEGWRGIGGMTESSAGAGGNGGALAQMARRLNESSENSSGIWVRLFELHGSP